MENSVELPIMGLLRSSFTPQEIHGIEGIAIGTYDSISEELMKAMLYEPYEYSRKVPLVSEREISSGKEFPPKSQISRIKGYKRNELIYNNKLKEALPGISKKLTVMQKYSAMKGLVAYLAHPITENYCRTITDNKLRFLYSSGVKIKGNKEESSYDIEEIGNIIRNQRIIQKVVIDISRFGEGIVVVEKGRKPVYVKPSNWFPVVDMEKDEITCHIVVDDFIIERDGKSESFLRVDYHYKGYYNRVVYQFDGSGIGKEVSRKNDIKTGVNDDFAVVVFNNSLDSLNLFGSDDYTIILSQIEDLVVSNCVESFCVHKFHFPSFQGPSQAAAKQADGSKGFELSPFYGIGQNQEIKQIEINFDIDALLAHKDYLRRTIAMLTGMKGTINDNRENGYAESGKARELRYADDIAATNEIKVFIDVQIKELIVKQGYIEGKNISINDVNIVWGPSIQMTQYDKAELSQILLGNKQIMSRQSVYEDVYDKDIDSALEDFKEYLEEMRDEKLIESNDL